MNSFLCEIEQSINNGDLPQLDLPLTLINMSNIVTGPIKPTGGPIRPRPFK